MALRSGYYGLKNATVKAVQKLLSDTSGAKIIKTIGNGLKLTSAGTLSCDIDSDTMEFKNGKLAAKTGGFDFSTDEVNTGQKWIDGKDIFCKVLSNQTLNIPGGATYFNISLSDLNIDTPIKADCIVPDEGIVIPWVTDSINSCLGVKYSKTAISFRGAGSARTVSGVNITLYYTKNASE